MSLLVPDVGDPQAASRLDALIERAARASSSRPRRHKGVVTHERTWLFRQESRDEYTRAISRCVLNPYLSHHLPLRSHLRLLIRRLRRLRTQTGLI